MRISWVVLILAAVTAGSFVVGYLTQRNRAAAIAQMRAKIAEEEVRVAQEAAAKAAAAPQPKLPSAADDADDEEAAYQNAMARRALTDNCLICHEEGMFTGQRLTAAQWKAEVDKMISWGAMMPDADRSNVETYLSKHFGEKSPLQTPGRVALAGLPTREIPGDPKEGIEGADLAKGAQLFLVVCASCHGPTALGTDLGPALADRAVLTHAGDYHKQVRDGLRKMPAMNSMLSADQQRDILAWLRTRDAAKP
ncbi:c-type cytochrome [Paludisphaera rhizosphaerae]|uniref:c-type cytochrome n=1 Tax=Paludisphaera rhizosphaerae TaxID=2711216 RepID=UPI0013EC63B2|nr:c-type cytochrome [Paludisphaera rhizosphaerae]